MKKLFLLFFYCCTSLAGFSQHTSYWQQQVDVEINVALNDQAHTLIGDIKMRYQNNSPDTLHYIWMHLWPNAYKNDRTAFSEQLLQNGRTDFYFSPENKKGYINRLSFKVNDELAQVEDHPQHQDIVKIILPSPLPPDAAIVIKTPFHEKLPEYFSRGGHINQSYMITQWYPKPAVYDKQGWHPMPYLDQGEFYSEFGNYKVNITLPSAYKVAATGTLQATSHQDDMKMLRFEENNVHDFAWFADKDFEVLHDTLQLPGKTIDVFAYYNKANAKQWSNSLQFIKNAVITKSSWLGEYPYKTVTVVEKAGVADGGGMEYPTITLISKTSDESMLDELINHEVGHNWFYGILASNERSYPWMDEGMNSYYDLRYKSWRQKQQMDYVNKGLPSFLKKRVPDNFEHMLLQTLIGIKKDQPIGTPSETFSQYNYGLVAYTKAAEWLQTLERNVGTKVFDDVMKQYYEQFKFKHPQPEDFKAVAESVSGKNLDTIFNLLYQKGSMLPQASKDVRLTSFINLKDADKHHYIAVAPAFGLNKYDGLMLGAAIHNFSLPMNNFHFFAAPLYATRSKKLNGIGRVGYTMYPGSNGAKLALSLSGAAFTVDDFKDSTGKKNSQPFSKIVPALRYTFANKNARSTVSRYVQWKTYLINETGLQFLRDTITGGDIISYPKERRTLHQLQFVAINSRALYPYDAHLQLEKGSEFVRTAFTGNYYFNYAKGGGLNVRLFAGKFFYTGDQNFMTQFETDRYHLNMTGAKGYEDYSYSDYFYGRNEFEGFANQQLMMRDGAFKVRTDLLSNKIGKTDNWLAALNFTSSVPASINPLALTPFKIPLKVFADIGTYDAAWASNSGSPRFLYDAGLQLSLFKNVVNVYFPILYSKVYQDYFKSTITEKRFLKNISFSIDLQNAGVKKLFPQIPL